jgi:hypothetical protein
MPLRRRYGALGAVIAALLLVTSLPTDAAPPVDTIDDIATATAVAAPIELPYDAVSVFQTGELTAGIRDAALAAARDAGAPAVVGRGFTALLTSVRRGTGIVQASSGAGWAFPMAVTALPLEAIGGVMGRDVAGIVAQGKIVMSQTSATLRGAQVGDLVYLVGAPGPFVIGRIGSDSEVGGTEIVMSVEMANRIGATIPTRVLIYGQFDRARLTAALYSRGLCTAPTGPVCITNPAMKAKVRRSWDPRDPDGQLTMAETKRIMGEFDFNYANLSTSGWTAMNPAWVARYLPTRDTYPTGIKAKCNIVIKPALRAALTEVVNSGLGGGIDAANANSYGGCATGSVRFARITQALGSVSRHSWGQPIDTNTTTNCQGCIPKLDCRIVRIFRKHGFAWGGNFLTPDGMHLEWVGERRDQWSYPSRFCANIGPFLAAPSTESIGGSAAPAVPTERETLFAEDGFIGDEHG